LATTQPTTPTASRSTSATTQPPVRRPRGIVEKASGWAEGIEGRIDAPSGPAVGIEERSGRVGGGSGNDISGGEGARGTLGGGRGGGGGRRAVVGAESSGVNCGREARDARMMGCGWMGAGPAGGGAAVPVAGGRSVSIFGRGASRAEP